ncbi:MAG: histidine kinase [Deltaproteobacteria bacterium]|nr:histidine kinase [Deltaproteobacteria bacterium]
MARWVILSIAVILVALTLVGGTMISLARREQAALLARFTEARQQRVERVAASVAHGLATAAENLRAVARLLPHATGEERQHALTAALALIKPFHLIEVFDAAGRRRLSVAGPSLRPRLDAASLQAVMAQSATRVGSLRPGALFVSPRLSGGPPDGYYVFAIGLPGAPGGLSGGVIAVLVDTRPFFEALGPLSAEHGSRLLVLDPAGRPGHATSERLLPLLDQGDAQGTAPGWSSVLRELRAGGRGARVLDEEEVRRAGLGLEPLVAAYAPVRVDRGTHWSLATFSSTAVLQAERRAALVRRGLISGALVVCFIGLAAFIFYAARRTAVLRDRLRYAAEIEYLHEKTEKILDNIPTGILALSDDGVTVAVNRVLRERMPPTALGAPLPEAFPEAASGTILRLRGLIEQTRLSNQVQSLFGEFLALFGDEERYNVHVVPLEPRFPDTRFLVVIEDLSEVRALEDQLLRAEKLATVGVLAAGIAHEIGTPLGVVRGRAEYVLGKLGPDHSQARGVQVIIEQIDHVTSTLRQLLDFSRVKSAVVRPVAVQAVVRTVLEFLRLETQQRRISTFNEVSETLPDVAADPDQLQQVFVNLIMNACDACAPGGRVTIRGRLDATPSAVACPCVRIEVVDDGHGIPAENRNQVFDPFFSTKKKGVGSGLGLAIVAQIVRNHRGAIELESEPGRGTCVTLLWPTVASVAPREEEPRDVA